jgi:AcrR family transcriptional regulator
MERHPTHQKILDEAIRIIEANGEAGLRVHDIEVAVSVTPPSIYHFFGSREG